MYSQNIKAQVGKMDEITRSHITLKTFQSRTADIIESSGLEIPFKFLPPNFDRVEPQARD